MNSQNSKFVVATDYTCMSYVMNISIQLKDLWAIRNEFLRLYSISWLNDFLISKCTFCLELGSETTSQRVQVKLECLLQSLYAKMCIVGSQVTVCTHKGQSSTVYWRVEKYIFNTPIECLQCIIMCLAYYM